MEEHIKLTSTSESYWIDSTPKTNYPVLCEDVDVDIAIIGGGLAGITCGYLLKKEGFRVAVIEADRICKGTTGHTTAKLTSQHGLIYNKIKTKMGIEMAKQYAEANETAIREVEKIVKENNIDCDLCSQSAYIYTQSDNYIQQIMDETKTASELGIKACYLEEIPLPFDVKSAVRFDNQAQFHPRKYVLALAEQIPGNGSYIFEHTRAVDINKGKKKEIQTNRDKKVTAPRVIIASHFPFYDGLGFYFARIHPAKSYIIGIKTKELFPGGMYINAESPARSLRSQKFKDGQMVLIAGEHHKTGHGDNLMKHYESLRDFAVNTFTVEDIMYRWSTQDCVTLDDVPYVGYLTSNIPDIYVATGFRKWGMTNSMASAMIIRDLIVKGDSPWKDVYSPSRFTPASVGTFVTQNADVAYNYVSGKLAPLPDNIEIKNDEARAVEVEGRKVGAYRDNQGNLHIVDTTCTHMGCELKWNDAEKTWDCPCHGSRFTYEGDIVEGPAVKQLNHLHEEPNVPDPNIV